MTGRDSETELRSLVVQQQAELELLRKNAPGDRWHKGDQWLMHRETGSTDTKAAAAASSVDPAKHLHDQQTMLKEAAARIIAQGQTVAQATVDVQRSQAGVAEAQRQVRMQGGIAEEKIRSAELQAQLAVEANATAAQMDVTLQRQAAEADIAQRNVEVRSKQTELEQQWQLAQERLQGERTNLEAGRLHSQQLAKAECERVRAEAQAEIEKTLQRAARAEAAALQRAEAAEDAMKRALQEAESQKEIRLKEKERRDWEVAFQIAASQQTQSFPRELAPAPGDRSLAPVRGDIQIAQAPGDGSQSNRVLPFVIAPGDGSQAQLQPQNSQTFT